MSAAPKSTQVFAKLVSRTNYDGWEILEYEVFGKKHFEASKEDNSIILRNYEDVIEMINSHSDHIKKAA